MQLTIDGITTEISAGERLLDVVRRLGLDSADLKTRPLAANIAGETFTLNYVPLREAGATTVREATTHPVAILFGREDRGLTNEELHRCHSHLHIPANPDYSVMNVATAVQVVAYEVRQAALTAIEAPASLSAEWDIKPATADALEYYFEHLEQTMVDIGFHNRDNPRQTMARLRRLYYRIRPDEMELAILRGILTGTQQMVQRAKQNTLEKSDD